MGKIGDFFRTIIKKEEEKLAKKYKGNIPREKLRKIAANSVLKKAAIKGGITLSCVIAGIAGYNISNNKEKNVVDNNIIAETQDLINNEITNEEDKKEDISSKIDGISTKDDALQFLKSIYVTEYNKDHNTEYSPNDIYLYNDSPQNYVYDVSGMYLTHGQTPDEVRKKLENENKDYDIKNEVKIYYSYVLDGDKKVVLEKFALDGTKPVNVILGEEYLDGKELSINENNTLLNMYNIILKGSELFIAYNNDENANSIALRKGYLENAVGTYNEIQNSKNGNIVGGR